MDDFYTTETKIPNSIEFTYVDFCDILDIHRIIIKKLDKNKELLKELEDKKFQLLKLKEKTSLLLEKNNIEYKIKNIENEIMDINSCKTLNMYLEETKDLIDKFNNGDKKITEDYIAIASKYYNLNIKKNYSLKILNCVGCNSKIDFKNSNDGFIVCKDCGIMKQITVYEKQNDEKNLIMPKNESLDFMKEFDKYICKTGTDKLKKEDLDKLIEYFGGIEKIEKIRKRKLNEYGKRDKTNVKMIIEACEKLNLVGLNDISMYIGKVLWEWELPNYEKYREKISQHYNEIQTNINNIPKDVKKRTSNLAIGFRMFRHIQLVCSIVDSSDFKIPENQDSFKNQDAIWQIATKMSKNPEIFYMEFLERRKNNIF